MCDFRGFYDRHEIEFAADDKERVTVFYGLNGAAIATLISISLYSLAKLLFVVLKMKLFPFTKNTIVALVLTIVSFVLFYYWDFSFHPFVNIILKSILVSIFYLGLSYYLKISSDINFVMNSVFKRIFK
jgi:hypothetical protein